MKYEKFIYTDDQSYCSSNSKFFLSNQIHLWKIPLDNFHQVQQSWSYLQKEEQKRASLLKVNSAFSRYIICRGAVRNILSMYLDILPQKIIINYEKHGKPYIFYPSTRLCFNVSHSSSCAILSIAYNKPIGIDIELVHPIDEIYSLSEIIFSRCWSNPFEEKNSSTKILKQSPVPKTGVFFCNSLRIMD